MRYLETNKLAVAGMLSLLSLSLQANAQSWERIAPCIDYVNLEPHVHVVKADLTCEGLKLVGTKENQSATTSSFAETNHVAVAVNADYFNLSTYPLGLAITNSKVWADSTDKTSRSFIACTAENICSIDPPDNLATPKPEWSIAVGGYQNYSNGAFACANSAPSECTSSNMNVRHPRTAIGLSANGKILYIVVVEGRLSNFDGMTLDEMSNIFKGLGVNEGLNLDGGGSSTLVIKGQRINALPSSQEQERIVANHFGIKAPPIRGRSF